MGGGTGRLRRGKSRKRSAKKVSKRTTRPKPGTRTARAETKTSQPKKRTAQKKKKKKKQPPSGASSKKLVTTRKKSPSEKPLNDWSQAFFGDRRVLEEIENGEEKVVATVRINGAFVSVILRRSEAGSTLTQRENDVAYFAAKGLGTNEISEKLGISAGTVKNHLKHVFQKLNIRSRVELMRDRMWQKAK